VEYRKSSEVCAHISFASPGTALASANPKAMGAAQGSLRRRAPLSIREAARRAGRDVKAVHGDVTALLNAGVLDRTDDGRIVFPFEAVKVEFLLQAA
jgi:predicted transcriptional regulator